MASQTSDPPASAEPPAGEPDKEAGRIRSLDERFKAIETEQADQRGMLEQIRDAVTGGHTGADGDQGEGAPAAPGPGEQRHGIGAEVRRQIEEAEKRRAAEEGERKAGEWRQSVEDRLEALKPEAAPREPQTGFRGRVQRAMFGRAD